MSDVSDGDADQQGEVNSSTAAAAAQAFGFTPGDHELLVRLVKLAQKMKYSAAGEAWAEYIALNVSSLALHGGITVSVIAASLPIVGQHDNCQHACGTWHQGQSRLPPELRLGTFRKYRVCASEIGLL